MAEKKAATTLGEELNAVLEATTPALRRLAQVMDEAAKVGREQYEERRQELQEQREKLDREINRRFR